MGRESPAKGPYQQAGGADMEADCLISRYYRLEYAVMLMQDKTAYLAFGPDRGSACSTRNYSHNNFGVLRSSDAAPSGAKCEETLLHAGDSPLLLHFRPTRLECASVHRVQGAMTKARLDKGTRM